MNCRDCENLVKLGVGSYKCGVSGARLTVEDLVSEYDCPRTLREKGITRGASHVAEVAEHYRDRELEMLRAWLEGDTATEIGTRMGCPRHVVAWYIEKFEREAKLVAEKYGPQRAAIREFMAEHGRKPTTLEATVLFREKGLPAPSGKKALWYLLGTMGPIEAISAPAPEDAPKTPEPGPAPTAEASVPAPAEEKPRAPEAKALEPQTPAKPAAPAAVLPIRRRRLGQDAPAPWPLPTVYVSAEVAGGAAVAALLRGMGSALEPLGGPMRVHIEVREVEGR